MTVAALALINHTWLIREMIAIVLWNLT